MKTRESGMPAEEVWQRFFDPEAILRSLGLGPHAGDIVEFGCGYGTFTIPAAQIVTGTVHALDIEPDMVTHTRAKADAAGLSNVRLEVRDFVEHGTGLPPASVAFAMLFNILHAEESEHLLREAYRVLAPGGRLGLIHWNHDPATPRGPPLEIRPRPEQCRDWALRVGFELCQPGIIDLPPYHYGVTLLCPPPDG